MDVEFQYVQQILMRKSTEDGVLTVALAKLYKME